MATHTDTMNPAAATHYCVIDRDTGERWTSTSSTGVKHTARELERCKSHIDRKEFCLGIGRIDPDGSISDVTDEVYER